MGLEKRINTRLIKFVIWSSYMKNINPQKLAKNAKSNGIDKLKDFFDSWIKQMKKDIDKTISK